MNLQRFVNTKNTQALLMIVVSTMFLLARIKGMPETFDVYYMSVLGEKVLQTSSISFENPMSAVDGAKVMVQQPLFCILTYYMLNYAPWVKDVYIILTSFAQMAVLYLLGRQYIKNWCTLLFHMLFSAFFISIGSSFRPMMMTICFLATEIILVKKYQSTNDGKFLKYLPLMAFLIANTHAALFSYSIIVLLPFTLPRSKSVLKSWIQDKKLLFSHVKRCFLVFVSMIAAAIFNPGGINSLIWTFKYVDVSSFHQYVGELKSLLLIPNSSVFFLVMGLYLLSIVMFVYSSITDTPVIQESALTFGLAIMAIVFIRNLFFLPLCIAPSLSFIRPKQTKTPVYIKILLSASLCLLSVIFYKNTDSYVPVPCLTPKEAISYICNDSGSTPKVLSTADSSCYMNFYGIKTLINDMPESGFKKMNGACDCYEDAMQTLITGDLSRIEQYDLDYVVLCADPECNYSLSESSNIKNALNCSEQWEYEGVYGGCDIWKKINK